MICMEKQREKTAMIVFTRVPIAGQTKTRLLSKFTPEQARDLHELFVSKAVKAALEARSKTGSDIFFFYTPTSERSVLQKIADRVYADLPIECRGTEEIRGRKVSTKDEKKEKIASMHDTDDEGKDLLPVSCPAQYIPQHGEDLWKRMDRAFAHCFLQGYDRVILFGTDIPEIAGSDLTQALSLLRYVDLVIAPTVDKGYYMIGMRHHIPAVFSDLDREDPDVLKASIRAIEGSSSYAILQKRNDIDTPQDLLALIGRLKRGDEGCRKNLDDILKIIDRR